MARRLLRLAIFQLGSGAPVELHGGERGADRSDRALRQSEVAEIDRQSLVATELATLPHPAGPSQPRPMLSRRGTAKPTG
eukprot:15475915-Alexandrium_andersonii.AAC.1